MLQLGRPHLARVPLLFGVAKLVPQFEVALGQLAPPLAGRLARLLRRRHRRLEFGLLRLQTLQQFLGLAHLGFDLGAAFGQQLKAPVGLFMLEVALEPLLVEPRLRLPQRLQLAFKTGQLSPGRGLPGPGGVQRLFGGEEFGIEGRDRVREA